MSSNYVYLTLVILIACNCIKQTQSSGDKKHKQPIYKPGSCSKFDSSIKIINVERDFIQLNGEHNLASLSSVDNELEIHEQCGQNEHFKQRYKNTIKINFKYQFIESLHCVRVELNLGNTSKFIQTTKFKYYMFSYRELTKTNTYMKRQLINESANNLVVYKAHLRPYIICVTFYENDYERPLIYSLNDNNSTNSTSHFNCDVLNSFIMKDSRSHDINMCIDIDTQLHFLAHPAEHEESHLSGNRELLMVVFIICLSAIILLLITAGHYIIEKPKKRRIVLQALRAYVQKKKYGQQTDNPNLINNSSQTLFKDIKTTNGPSITVTDFSSSNTLCGINNNNGKTCNNDDDSKETDSMLLSSTRHDHFTASALSSLHSHDHANNTHKVTFVIGETIIEEPATYNDSLNEINQQQQDNDEANNNPNEESVKSVSHLLDDKPWITSSLPAVGSTLKLSRNNSIISQSQNN